MKTINFTTFMIENCISFFSVLKTRFSIKNLQFQAVIIVLLFGFQVEAQTQTPIEITNGDFSQDVANATTGFTGWTVTKSDASSTIKVSTAAKGNPTFIVGSQNHAQLNRTGGGAGTLDISQTLSVPNGTYTVSADVVTSLFSYTGAAKLYANADSTLVPAQAAGSRLSATTVVTDGTLKFGIGFNISSVGITLEIDNFTVVRNVSTMTPSVDYTNISLNNSSDELFVSSSDNISSVSINTISGQNILVKKLNSNNGTISLNGLNTGIYLVTIETATKNKLVKKIVLSK